MDGCSVGPQPPSPYVDPHHNLQPERCRASPIDRPTSGIRGMRSQRGINKQEVRDAWSLYQGAVRQPFLSSRAVCVKQTFIHIPCPYVNATRKRCFTVLRKSLASIRSQSLSVFSGVCAQESCRGAAESKIEREMSLRS